MRVAANSDLHANPAALEAVLADVDHVDVGEVDGFGRALVCHSTPSSEEPISPSLAPDGDLVDPPAAADTAPYLGFLRGS